MKIGIDARLWSETGVGRYIRNLVYNLAEIDKTNDYVLFMRSADADKFKVQSSKFKVVRVDIRWHTLDEQLKLPQILNKENLDLVHFPYFSIPVGYKNPFVITIHDLIINHFPTGKASKLPLYLYQLKKLGYDYVVKNAVNKAQKIIVPLNAVKDDLIETLGVKQEKIIVTYEGFDEKIQKKDKVQIVDKTKYFLYVGNAYPHKNLDRLIKAFSLFRKEDHENIQLVLVGKDDFFYKKLNEKILKENYSGVVVRNNVTDKELAGYYQNAIALISPSLMEGFGLPVLEAMASACQVIASDIPSLREVCLDAAIYFDPYSIEDIKNKINDVFSLEQNILDKNIKKGLERSKEFSWRKMAKETLAVYESSISLR
ncbi:MAG TPA: glycosyltransferase family 1 protein [Candidatus Limnocylindrales bacterium]|nr:glycosyltransferase family 1 protein [Candidatus Limnocylindrales bacterium]